jgi:PAS domain S-box-containing protein
MKENSYASEAGLLDNLEDRIYSFDLNCRLIFANRPMKEDFFKAFKVNFEPGVFILENVPEPIFSEWEERYKRALSGEEFSLTDQLSIEGVPEYIMLTFKPLYSNGSIIGATCHSRDITLQVIAEQKIRENEFHLNAQINNTKESIWSVDSAYRILTTNDVFRTDFQKVFGHELRKGDCVLDFFEGELRREWKSRYDLALSGKHFTKTDKFEFGDFLKYSEVAFNPIYVDGKIVGVAGFTKDMTEIVAKQQELEHALEKAKEADRLKSAFVANISHEIRSPLNSILGLSELAFDEEYTPIQKSVFRENMLRSGEHLIEVIDSIIDISIIESGQLNLRSENIELNELLGDCVKIVESGRKIKTNTIYFKRKEPCFFFADRKRLKQIVINLLTNANKFTTNGSIWLDFEVESSQILITIKDTGVGIEPTVGDNLFKRFFRADNNKDFAHGTGLGLAISKALVEAFGGRIWYDSEVGKGTTFSFTLPNPSV